MKMAIESALFVLGLAVGAAYAQDKKIWVMDERCLAKVVSTTCPGTGHNVVRRAQQDYIFANSGNANGIYLANALQTCAAAARLVSEGAAEHCWVEAPSQATLQEVTNKLQELVKGVDETIKKATAEGMKAAFDTYKDYVLKYEDEVKKLRKELEMAQQELKAARDASKAKQQ